MSGKQHNTFAPLVSTIFDRVSGPVNLAGSFKARFDQRDRFRVASATIEFVSDQSSLTRRDMQAINDLPKVSCR